MSPLLAILLGLGAFGGYPILKSLLSAYMTGPKMAGIQSKLMEKQHGLQLKGLSMLSGKQIAREKEFLDRMSSVKAKDRQERMQHALLGMLGQSQAGGQAAQSNIVSSLGAGAQQPPFVPGMGMVDLFRR